MIMRKDKGGAIESHWSEQTQQGHRIWTMTTHLLPNVHFMPAANALSFCSTSRHARCLASHCAVMRASLQGYADSEACMSVVLVSASCTTGCTAFSVQGYCDRRLIPLSRIPRAEFLSNCKPEPCRFSPAIPCSDSVKEYAKIFSQFLRKYSTSVGTSGILNEYLYIDHALGGTSGNLTQYLHHGPCSNFYGKP